MLVRNESKGFHFTPVAVSGILMIVKWLNQTFVLIKQNRLVDQ